MIAELYNNRCLIVKNGKVTSKNGIRAYHSVLNYHIVEFSSPAYTNNYNICIERSSRAPGYVLILDQSGYGFVFSADTDTFKITIVEYYNE